jgi:hypothetical protein
LIDLIENGAKNVQISTTTKIEITQPLIKGKETKEVTISKISRRKIPIPPEEMAKQNTHAQHTSPKNLLTNHNNHTH